MSEKKYPCILLSAGEASGDLLAGNLAKALFTRNPDLTLVGMGGKKMADAGVDIIFDAASMSIVGIFAILTHLKTIRLALKKIAYQLDNHRPDLVVIVDYPGFNFRVAKMAHERGIKVVQYVSPQIWAWRYGRIKKTKKYIDHVAVLYEFEEAIYQKENIPVTFVGHPMAELAKPDISKGQAFERFKLSSKHPVIGFFPGSRDSEIEKLLPIMIESIPFIVEQLPDAQFVLPLASTISEEQITALLPEQPKITIVRNDNYNLLQTCSAVVAASGTATLEIAFNQVPLVIVYKFFPLSYFLGRLIFDVKKIGLCNIINQEDTAKELLQNDATPDNIANELVKLITDTDYRAARLNAMAKLPNKLGGENAVIRAAEVVEKVLKQAQ